jgi:hypothetical protein
MRGLLLLLLNDIEELYNNEIGEGREGERERERGREEEGGVFIICQQR